MTDYHQPVMLQECLDGLKINPEGNYVDVTYGGGGHSKAILQQLTTGKLMGFDQDKDAHENAVSDERFVLAKSNFRFLKNFVRLHRMTPLDGVLADLGVSSHQFNQADRGFSIRFDAELDMRMDQGAKVSAKEVVNGYGEEKLAQIFWQYGELKQSRKIAALIVKAREDKKIEKVFELKELVSGLAPLKKQNQFYAQLFQALRIEVNDELGALKEMLEQSVELLDKGGRLVVMSYHSLEDRLVKNFMRAGNFEGKQEKDFFGKLIRPLEPINNKVIVPTDEEIEMNPRARSAKLRIAEKI
tara:strand:- start:1263 stop:2162 length:900 start_codon:yes stop_codon:yes gene_type:complete